MNSKVTACSLLSAFLIATLAAGDYAVKNLKLNRPDGFYKCGEEVVVTGQLVKAGRPVTEGKLRVVTKWEGSEIASQELPCDGEAFRFTYKGGDKPGWVYFGFHVVGADGKIVNNPLPRPIQLRKNTTVAEIGAMFEPEKLCVSYPLPEDFLDFWKAERAKLDKVPLDAKVEKVDSGDPKVELYAVQVETGADHPVTAYMAIPAGAKPESLPIFIQYQSHTTSDILPRVAIGMAKRGALAMNATWHGLPLRQPAEFYKKECRRFPRWKNLNRRDQWVWHGMYLRVLRAIDYLKTRPEWNGRDLIVQGGSLGGVEAACAAALDPAVTMAIISICGFCD